MSYLFIIVGEKHVAIMCFVEEVGIISGDAPPFGGEL